MLDTPNGPTVAAVCKVCGAEKEFPTTHAGQTNADFSLKKHPHSRFFSERLVL